MNVDTTHKQYDKWLPRWTKCRAVAEAEVKEARAVYLPPLSGHDGDKDPEYLAYVMRAHYYNATGRTIDALSGTVFEKNPNFVIPDQMEDFSEDVTLSGCTLEELANDLIEELLRVGRTMVLVDHVGTGEDLTVRIAEARNLRPKLVNYKTEQMINWRYENVNNRQQLTLVVLKEVIDEPLESDPFMVDEKTQYRVLSLEDGFYKQEVWEKVEGNFVVTSSFEPRIRGKRFDYIPLFVFGPCNARDIEKPPLMDLVETNLAHYRTSADYEHGVHFTGLPTLFGKGFKLAEGESFPIGSSNAYVRSESDADAKFIEFEGKGLSTLEANLERKEQHMASLGARLLQESPRQVETAQAVNTKQSGENSVLASLAKSTSKGLKWCMDIAAEWMNVSGDLEIELSTDYLPDEVDANTLGALMRAVQSNLLSKESFLFNVQRGGYLPEDRTLDDEMEDIESEEMDSIEKTHDEAEFMASVGNNDEEAA